MGERLLAYLRLMRPANIVTAFADILAGVAVSGVWEWEIGGNPVIEAPMLKDYGLLLLSTLGLYGGGVVFNDVFDFKLDQQERPERPLPSGKASLTGAIILGISLFVMGILSAFLVTELSGILACIIVVLVLSYNAWSKHHVVLGPINMGLCRAGNLLLGVSIYPLLVFVFWPLGFVPLLYIGAITLVSQGEVHGGNRKALQLAMGVYIFVFLLIVGFGVFYGNNVLYGLPFVALLAYLTLPALQKAMKSLQPQDVMKAVKAGVIALIVLDSAIAAIFGGILWGLCILLLLPLSLWLGKAFAIT